MSRGDGARRESCVVIGCGPAGLATAASLRRAGVDPLVIDRGAAVAERWHSRYDGFRLNTSSWFSYLPGRRFPREAGRWPSREALVAYYTSYSDDHRLRIELNTAAERIDHADGAWRIQTNRGAFQSSFVVVATGKYGAPTIPAWSGRDQFEGELIHSAHYRSAKRYRDKDVMVVGAGASGFEIATQLAHGGARTVRLSIRTPPHIFHRQTGPFPTDLFAVLGRRLPVPLVDAVGRAVRRLSIGDLSRYGLPAPEDGIYSRLKRTGMIPTADGPYIDAVKARVVEIVPAVEALDGRHVELTNGARVQVDAVIAATGYRRGLEPLVGHLGVLDPDGRPLVHGRRTHPAARGLHFIGFTEPLSGNLREMRFDARKIARAIARAHPG